MLIAQITDLHLGLSGGYAGDHNSARLARVLDALVALDPRPELLLVTGDLVENGDLASYRQLHAALSGLPFPVHCTLGNHDDRATFHAVFADAPGTDPAQPAATRFVQQAIAAGPLRVLLLDTLEQGRHGGGFCTTRAAWLTARLDEDSTTPTLIALHHPPVETGIAWMNTDPAEPWVERLALCLRGRGNVVGLACGHLHRTVATRWEGLPLTICPGTAAQVALDFRPIDPALADGRALIVEEPPVFALHWWNGRELITHWQTVGSYPVLARYDAQRLGLIERLLAERPVVR